jgi:hypothetical protein
VTADEAVVAVIDTLETAGIPYMIVGSLASNVHGIPRSTRDADLVVEADPSGWDRLGRALPASLRLHPQGAFEAVTGTIRYLIELSGSPFVCELFSLSDDPHDRERFRRRQRIRLLDREASVASVEDMIVTKLRWAVEARRAKDRDDVRNMIAVRGDSLDWRYIRQWCAVHRTLDQLEAIRSTIPPA